MSVRVRIKGKEYTVKETVRNVERTYIIQKKFMSLAGKVDQASKDFDAEELDASAVPSITETIQSNLDNLNAIAEYIADMVDNEKITIDFLKDNLLYDDFQSLLFKLVNGILHIDDDQGAAEGKK
jgi:hypothetical protein